MAIIKNPNEIVSELVEDYKQAYGDGLLGVVMYGSAVTHEYRPGTSDVNIIVIIKDNSVEQLTKCIRVAQKWLRRKVAIPFFMTPEFIVSALDSYPVEMLDIQSAHRILFGEDYFSNLEIDRDDLRLQCERELRGVSIHLRKEFVGSAAKSFHLGAVALASMKKNLPVFKALLRLNNKPVPKIRSDVVMAIEDLYGLGASALSGILNLDRQGKRPKLDAGSFEAYSKTVDSLIVRVDSYHQEKEII
jgi:hypothetical protein